MGSTRTWFENLVIGYIQRCNKMRRIGVGNLVGFNDLSKICMKCHVFDFVFIQVRLIVGRKRKAIFAHSLIAMFAAESKSDSLQLRIATSFDHSAFLQEQLINSLLFHKGRLEGICCCFGHH